MEFDLVWLLILPVLFAMGWLAARVDLRQRSKERAQVSSTFFQGVNFLLSDQPDRAIDRFLELAHVDQDTVEIHFALAKLFRRRGEIDRALRLHDFLSQRKDLTPMQWSTAQFELGVDYLKAGVLDRAEQAFLALASSPRSIDAAQQLLQLYELEQAWSKAIQQAEHMQALGIPVPSNDRAHFYCEQAQIALQQQRVDDAKSLLDQALALHPSSVRAVLMLGEIAFNAGDVHAALAAWQKSEQQNPWYLPLVGPHVWRAYEALNDIPAGLQALANYNQAYPSIDLLRVWLEAAVKHLGATVARVRLREAIRHVPSLLGLDALLALELDLHRKQNNQPDFVEELELMRQLIARHTQRLSRYRCHQCGFETKSFYWQCPGCARWDSIIPRRIEELDFYPVTEGEQVS